MSLNAVHVKSKARESEMNVSNIYAEKPDEEKVKLREDNDGKTMKNGWCAVVRFHLMGHGIIKR